MSLKHALKTMIYDMVLLENYLTVKNTGVPKVLFWTYKIPNCYHYILWFWAKTIGLNFQIMKSAGHAIQNIKIMVGVKQW